jgi:DNA invertase Pin-like site-specific DNA recombinase
MGRNQTTIKKRAVAYIRISVDRVEELSTDSQRRTIAEYCDSHGMTLIDVEEERGRSAFKNGGRQRRPGLDRALELIENGGADVLIVWRLDRFVRSGAHFAKVWERLEAADGDFVSVAEQFDTTTAMGRAMLRIAVVFAELESDIKSERISEWHRERDLAGAPPVGPRAFGYTCDRAGLVDVEAAAVRDAAGWVLDGVTLGEVCRRFDARPDVNPLRAARWSRDAVKWILTSPATAKLAERDGVLVDGWWPGPSVLDRARWEHVRSVLAAHRPNPRRVRNYPLVGLLHDAAGHPMNGTEDHGRVRYRVAGGVTPFLSVDAGLLEAEVVAQVDARVDPAALAAAAAGMDVDVAAELVGLQRHLAELAVRHATGDLTAGEWEAMRGPMRARLAVLESQDAAGPRSAVPETDAATFAEAWERWDNPARRAALDAVVDRVVIAPRPPGAPRNRWDPSRVHLVWRI